MMPDSYTGRQYHFVENDRHQNTVNVDLQRVDNQPYLLPPPAFAEAPVHVEPGTQQGRLEDSMSWKRNGRYQELFLQDDVVGPRNADYAGAGVYTNSAAKRHLVQHNSFPPVTSVDENEPARRKYSLTREESSRLQEQVWLNESNSRRNEDYAGDGIYMNSMMKRHSIQQNSFPPATSVNENKPAGRKYSLTRKDSSRFQEQAWPNESNSQRNEDYGEDTQDSVQVSVQDVHSTAVAVEARVSAGAADSWQAVMSCSKTANQRCNSVDTAAKSAAAMPVCDSIVEDRINDARKCETAYHMQTFDASSISAGEVMDTEGIKEWSDLDTVAEDTVAEDTAAMPVDDSVYEDKISDARRRKSIDKSLHYVQSSFTPSISYGEVIVHAQDTVVLENEAQSLPRDAMESASSKTVDQPALNPGSDARRRKSTDKSLHYVPSSFTPSVSYGEVIVNAQDTVVLETEGQSLPRGAIESAHSKTLDQPALNPGRWYFVNVLLNLCYIYYFFKA